MIQAILFDMDGTLIDSEKYYVEGTYTWMKRNGYQGSLEAIYAIIGTTMEKTYQILGRLSQLDRSKIAQLNSDYFNLENPLDYAKIIFPEVKAVLKALKQDGLKLALCTSSGQKEVDKFIAQCGLENIFDAFFVKETIKNPKPNPEIYLKALAAFKLKISDVIVVEDSKEGISAAKNAQLYTLARKDYRYGIDQSASDEYIDNLNDLLRWMRSRNDG